MLQKSGDGSFYCFGYDNVVEQGQTIDGDLLMGGLCADAVCGGIHRAHAVIKGRVTGAIRKNPQSNGHCVYESVRVDPSGFIGSIEDRIMFVYVAGTVEGGVQGYEIVIRNTANIGGPIRGAKIYVEEGFKDRGIVSGIQLPYTEPDH